jgi:hypothetical protein
MLHVLESLSGLGAARWFLWAAAISVVAANGTGLAADSNKKGSSMSYGEVRDFLAEHTQLVELTAENGARVAVAPAWQGRVMTSTCDGLQGPSFGFVYNDFIAAKKYDNPHFNNYGGEDRLWLTPEGGQFSLWFKPGEPQNLANWRTMPALNDAPWIVTSSADPSHVAMKVDAKFQNASGSDFHVEIVRDVRLLKAADLQKRLGEKAGRTLQSSGIKMVAYETDNQLINRGPRMEKSKGLTSIWILSMLNAGPQAVTIIPYRQGSEAELGPVVRRDYFGPVPDERLQVTPQAVLFRDDANYRAKLGISQRRAKNILGAIDFETGVLSIVTFSMPDDPTKHLYPNSAWEMPQKEPFRGDVVNAYNDGPNDTGGRLGDFYELESVSPTQELNTGESLSHRSAIIHVQADHTALVSLAKDVLGVDLDAVRRDFLKP